MRPESGGEPEGTRGTRSGRRPTLEDVAAVAGVSRALVSIVVRGVPGASEETRKRVLEVAAELGYRPDARARLLAQERSRLLGVTMSVDDPFHAGVIAPLYAAADVAGYEIALSALVRGRDEKRAVETLLDYRCAALVLLGGDSRAGWLAGVGERLPVVSLGQPAGPASVDVVRTADDTGARLAVDHLVDLGHTRIAHLDGGRGSRSGERRRGYRAAMRRHGLAAHTLVVGAGHDESSGREAGARLLAQGPVPTAVFCYNDRCAVGLLEAADRAGLDVPGDLAVVGYDDSPLARLWRVDLTSVAQDVAGLATLAVQRAVARAEGPGLAVGEVVLPPRLVVRGSTGAPTAATTTA